MREIQDGNNTLTYVLPDVVDPPEYICVTLRIPNNKYHIMAFKGALWDLCNWWNWERDDAKTATRVAQVWRRVFRSIKFTDCAPKQTDFIEVETEMALHVDCDCNVTVDCCDGTTKQLATVDMLKGGTQPAGGSPQPTPGGGTQCYNGSVDAKNTWLVPTLVSTGDKFHINSSTGAENDGGDAHWKCPDGSNYAAGNCFATGRIFDGTDPCLTAYHMSLIVVIDGTAYPLMNGDLTVPAGHSNAQAEIQANDSDISNNKGSFSFEVCITNNTTPPLATWCHLSTDLTDLATYWSPFFDGAIYDGTYSGGAWHSAAGTSYTALQISNNIPIPVGTVFTKIVAHTTGCSGNGNGDLFSGAACATLVQAIAPMTSETQTWMGSNTTYRDVYCIDLVNGTDNTKNFSITSIEIHGTGPNPFGASNC